METWPASRKQFSAIDVDRQMMIVTTLVTSRMSPWPAKLTREITFAQIESVYLDLWEDSRLVPDRYQDEYGSAQHLQVKQRWMLGVQLKDGETVTLYDEVTDQPASETSNVSLQRGYWESLAQRVSSLVGKPLMRIAPPPTGPRTFVEAIDQILQRRLEHAPLAGRSVHLRGKEYGVDILVDGKAYGSLDEIEDTGIRSAVRAAIDEWQRNNP